METRFLIVRHPETTANATGRYVGRGDAPYTELGSKQVGLLASEITSCKPDRIFSSPLRRAREVAEAAASALGLELTLDERLTELDFGQAEGYTHDEIEAMGLTFDFHSMDAPVAPGGESRRDIYLRSQSFAEEQKQLGGIAAIVTHGGVFRSMLADLLHLPMDSIWSFDIRPAQIAELRMFDGRGTLMTFRRPRGEDVAVPPDEPRE